MKRPTRRSHPTIIVSAFLLLALTASTTWAAQPGDQAAAMDQRENYVIDDSGRPLRVNFPLHDRITFDAFAAGNGDGGATEQAYRSGLSFGISHSFRLDYPDDEIWWQFRQTWLDTTATAAPGTGFVAGTSLRSTLLQGSYLRHDKSSFVVVPGATNLRFPTPFDIAFEYALLGVEFDPASTIFSAIDVAEFAVLLDFIRDPSYRHRLAIGPTASYEIWRGDSEPDAAWSHYFVPMTGGRLVYGWESATGRFATGAEVECAAEAELSGQGLNWQRRCAVGAHSEWTILAINDKPISLIVDASVGEPGQRLDTGAAVVWEATAGLRFSLPGKP